MKNSKLSQPMQMLAVGLVILLCTAVGIASKNWVTEDRVSETPVIVTTTAIGTPKAIGEDISVQGCCLCVDSKDLPTNTCQEWRDQMGPRCKAFEVRTLDDTGSENANCGNLTNLAQNCQDIFRDPTCQGAPLHMKLFHHSSVGMCGPLFNLVTKMCVVYDSSCANVDHNGCSTFADPQLAMTTLQDLIELNDCSNATITITGNQSPSICIPLVGILIKNSFNPLTITANISCVSCTYPSCDFEGECTTNNDIFGGGEISCASRGKCQDRNGDLQDRLCCGGGALSFDGKWKHPWECPKCNGVCCSTRSACNYVTRSQCQAGEFAGQWLDGIFQCTDRTCPRDLGACCRRSYDNDHGFPDSGAAWCENGTRRADCPAGYWHTNLQCNSEHMCEVHTGACCFSSGGTSGANECIDGVTDAEGCADRSVPHSFHPSKHCADIQC